MIKIDTLLKLFKLCFASFGIMLFIIILVDAIKKLRKPKLSKNRIYILCERYVNIYNNGDGYWLTDTEMQLYKELEKQLKLLNVIE